MKRIPKASETEGPGVSALIRMIALALVVFMLPGAIGCFGNASERELFAMDTFMQLKAYGAGAQNALDEACALIEELDGLFSVTNEKSEVYAIDHAKGGSTAVSPETFELISRALDFSAQTGDCFEITLRPVSEAWGFTGGTERIPGAEELSALLELVGDEKVTLDASSRTITLENGAAIDLGALAKGYAADSAAECLKAAGVKAALLNLGSSTILAFGQKPEGGRWRIAVHDPAGAYENAGLIELFEGAVSTSGGYERYFTGDDGQIYWHILDPRTGMPARNGIASVSVITDEAFIGDGLSTALFVMGEEAAAEYWRAVGGFEFIMLMEDGSIVLTSGASELFTPGGSYKDAEIRIIRDRDTAVCSPIRFRTDPAELGVFCTVPR